MVEVLDPNYLRALQESLLTIANALQNLTRSGFDDTSRLRARVEYMDDGYVRVRDTSGTVDLLEALRELSWVLYNQAEASSLLSRAIGTSDSEPPLGGVVMLGFDGSVLRRVRVASDGKLLAVLG